MEGEVAQCDFCRASDRIREVPGPTEWRVLRCGETRPGGGLGRAVCRGGVRDRHAGQGLCEQVRGARPRQCVLPHPCSLGRRADVGGDRKASGENVKTRDQEGGPRDHEAVWPGASTLCVQGVSSKPCSPRPVRDTLIRWDQRRPWPGPEPSPHPCGCGCAAPAGWAWRRPSRRRCTGTPWASGSSGKGPPGASACAPAKERNEGTAAVTGTVWTLPPTCALRSSLFFVATNDA